MDDKQVKQVPSSANPPAPKASDGHGASEGQGSQVKQVTQVMGDDFQGMYTGSNKFKSQLDEIAAAMQSGGHPEMEPHSTEAPRGGTEMVQEIPTQPELEKKPELSGYIENVEKAAESITPVIDDYTNQVLLGNSNPQNVKIKLPMTEPQIEEGLHHKVWEAVRWLAEWCLRQLKIVKTKEAPDILS